MSKGTSDTNLDKMAKDLEIKNYRGCYMRNTLPDKPLENECGIINCQSDIEGNGTHWQCWYKNGETKIFFDSFGTSPSTELVNYLGHGILSSTFQIQRLTNPPAIDAIKGIKA